MLLPILAFLTLPLVVVLTFAIKRLLMLEEVTIPWWWAATSAVLLVALSWVIVLIQVVTTLHAVVPGVL